MPFSDSKYPTLLSKILRESIMQHDLYPHTTAHKYFLQYFIIISIRSLDHPRFNTTIRIFPPYAYVILRKLGLYNTQADTHWIFNHYDLAQPRVSILLYIEHLTRSMLFLQPTSALLSKFPYFIKFTIIKHRYSIIIVKNIPNKPQANL